MVEDENNFIMKVAFFDRDGVINKDISYLYKWEYFEYQKLVKTALLRLVEAEYKIIIVTNQSGIARGFYSEDDFLILMSNMKQDLEKSGIDVLDVFYCPHHVDGVIKNYVFDCSCRKPKPGLFFKAYEKYDINLAKSAMFGDRCSDLEAAQAAGITNRFLIQNDFGSNVALNTFENLQEAVDTFLISV